MLLLYMARPTPASTVMMTITINSSINVNPALVPRPRAPIAVVSCTTHQSLYFVPSSAVASLFV